MGRVGWMIRVGSAVLGDVQRQVAGPRGDEPEDLTEAFGVNLPAEARLLSLDGGEGRQHRRTDDVARVVVDAQEVDGRRDELEIAVADEVTPGVLRRVRGIAAAGERVEEPPVVTLLRGGGGLEVEHLRAGRLLRHDVEDDADTRVRCHGADGLDGPAVSHEQMVSCGQSVIEVVASRREDAVLVSQRRHDPRFVERDEVADAVTEAPGHDRGVLGERIHGRPKGPPPGVLEDLRQVPVIERHERRDALGEQLVDQAIVEVEPCLVDRACAAWDDPRPRDGEPVRAETEFGQQRHVLAVAVVVVAGDVARIAVERRARRVREAVPDAFAAAVFVDRPLDLIRGRRGTPHEIRRERSIRHGHDERVSPCRVLRSRRVLERPVAALTA